MHIHMYRKSMPAVVRLLIQRNARTDIEDKYGDLAIDHASEARTANSFSILSSRSNNENTTDDIDKATPSTTPRRGMPPSFSYELLLRTIKFLDAKDVCRAACVAGKWHRGKQ
mgnify:CR=1 FL=1